MERGATYFDRRLDTASTAAGRWDHAGQGMKKSQAKTG